MKTFFSQRKKKVELQLLLINFYDLCLADKQQPKREEKKMEWPDCVICQEQVFFPANFTCFHKDNSQTINCQNSNPICYKCARKYIQNTPIERLKCIFCNIPFEPHYPFWKKDDLLKDGIKVNFALMNIHTKRDFPCLFHEHGCSFTGKMMDIWAHYKSCDYREVMCGECHAMFPLPKTMDHFAECPFYQKCTICSEPIRKTSMIKHMEKKHKLHRCNWCSQYVGDLKKHKTSECPHREERVECPLGCHYRGRKYNFQKNKLADHIQEIHIEPYQKINDLYQNFLNEWKDINFKLPFQEYSRQERWILRTMQMGESQIQKASVKYSEWK